MPSTTKKTADVKPAEKTVKTDAPAAVAAPAAKAEVKAAPKAAASKIAVYVQFGEKSYSYEDLVKIAKDVWVYDLGKKAADFKSADIYVKPEENTVYFVVNDKELGNYGL